MNILLYGDDKLVMREKLASFRLQFKKLYPDGEIMILFGDELPMADELADLLGTDSLFGNKKLIVLKDFGASLANKKNHALLPWFVRGGEQHTIIYYAEDDLEAVKHAHIQDLLAQKHLEEKYVFFCRRGRLTTQKLVLTPAQKMYLEQVHMLDTALAAQEIAKAELLQRAGKSELVDTVFNDYQFSISVFPFLDSLFAKDSAKAASLLKSLFDQGENELMLLTMVINHLKKILFLLDAETKRSSPDEVLKKLRIHAFVAKKMLQQKRNFSLATAKLWLAKLLEIDLLAKQGKVDAKVALNQFCVSIDMY